MVESPSKIVGTFFKVAYKIVALFCLLSIAHNIRVIGSHIIELIERMR